jgi:hypothetical protein
MPSTSISTGLHTPHPTPMSRHKSSPLSNTPGGGGRYVQCDKKHLTGRQASMRQTHVQNFHPPLCKAASLCAVQHEQWEHTSPATKGACSCCTHTTANLAAQVDKQQAQKETCTEQARRGLHHHTHCQLLQPVGFLWTHCTSPNLLQALRPLGLPSSVAHCNQQLPGRQHTHKHTHTHTHTRGANVHHSPKSSQTVKLPTQQRSPP